MRSLAVKLTLAFLLVGLTGAVLVAVIVQRRTNSAFNQFLLNREQQIFVDSLIEYYEFNGSWDGVGAHLRAFIRTLPPVMIERMGMRRDWMGFVLVDTDRRVVFSIPPGQTGRQVSSQEVARGYPLEVNGKVAGWLLLAESSRDWKPDSPESLFLKNFNRAIIISAFIAGALALTLGGVLAYTLTRSLRELKQATEQIAAGNLGLQIKVRSKDELGELASSFNRMSRDLAQAAQARRQMTADIAHELRSPLSVLAGYAEALSEGKLPGTPETYEILDQETRHLSRLVDDLRTLSLADAGELPLLLSPMSPQEVLNRAAGRQAVAAEQKGVAIRVQAEDHLPAINVDSERIAQVLDNLLTNALRYTPAGGEISLCARRTGKGVALEVRDTGSGIPPEDLPFVFDRFYRGDKARRSSGESGLGLAIARSIVVAHGGSIQVDSKPGTGTVFTILLQAASAP